MIQLAVVLLWFVACSIQDLLQRHISNLLTVGGAALAFLYMLWSGHTLLGASAAEGGWALLIALLLTLPGYALNKLGAGDVKLLMALALATDRPTILGTVIGAGIFSGLCWFFASKILPSINQRVKTLSFSKDAPLSIKLPFAPFLFAGFALTVALLR